ncbi:MAG: 2,4'-dihydroxyacetophenone dioxygenase family protein [Rhodococcus sp. (in: high G+C Gram-positive bacteria)]|nr:2,4'-dihydroxyacetophenone dioxygenase family protein [Rhodococcus sp. (in: high G+C Gram-positive bacteria)]MDI6627752.1 2,4'-dihydroxyacetophenone dioxygenase family protein [Rhodococcus sp. (in: high G+C Gram-positive bacteria)]
MPATTSVGPAFWMTNPGTTPKGTRREFVDHNDIPWTDWLMPGTRFRLLYANLVTGSFTVVLQVDPGVQATPHWHMGNVQAYILDGGFHYHEDDPGLTGTYTCEVAGAVHEPIAPEGTTMLAFVEGPIAGYMPDGSLGVIADARLHYYMARDNDAIARVQLVDYATDPSTALHDTSGH